MKNEVQKVLYRPEDDKRGKIGRVTVRIPAIQVEQEALALDAAAQRIRKYYKII